MHRAGQLVAEHLGKRFGAAIAVADVSFVAAAGSVLGLLGPNGAGKSTTAGMLAGIVKPEDLPALVAQRCGERRGHQLGTFINAMIRTIRATGVIGMDARHSEALAAFRTFNYETIYLRSASRQQASAVVAMLRALVEYFAVHPSLIPDVADDDEALDSPAKALELSVAYVAGMPDRFACHCAVDWPIDQLPSGIDR